MTSHPSYEQSKQVAEASRETEWTKPSFGKELFLGNFRLDLIHPQPELDAAAVKKGETFLERLRAFLTEHVDRQQIEREARIPESVLDAALGAPVDRPARAAALVRLGGAEAPLAAPAGQGPDLGVPAHRARRRL